MFSLTYSNWLFSGIYSYFLYTFSVHYSNFWAKSPPGDKTLYFRDFFPLKDEKASKNFTWLWFSPLAWVPPQHHRQDLGCTSPSTLKPAHNNTLWTKNILIFPLFDLLRFRLVSILIRAPRRFDKTANSNCTQPHCIASKAPNFSTPTGYKMIQEDQSWFIIGQDGPRWLWWPHIIPNVSILHWQPEEWQQEKAHLVWFSWQQKRNLHLHPTLQKIILNYQTKHRKNCKI